jgi:heme exporter protein C
MPLFRFASPQTFYPLAGRLAVIAAVVALAGAAVGLWLGLLVAPADAQQGEVYRLIYIHVPSAWMAMFTYLVMAGYAVLALVLRARLAAMMMRALAPTGALMAAIALWTGAIWGKPTWGTYWAWDARMTSTLVLLFLYFGFIALVAAIEDPVRGDRAGAVLLLVGVINVPIIYFSVRWWNTLHQGASLTPAGSAIAPEMLRAMLIMTVAAWAYTIAVSLHRVRSIILERERHARWARELPGIGAPVSQGARG